MLSHVMMPIANSIVFVVFISPSGRRLRARSIAAEPSILGIHIAHLSVRIFPRDRFTGIDPVRVHIHGRREIVDASLEVLAADFAVQQAHTELLV